MKKISSFTIDHTILQKGMYTSRIDGDCVTYDIRTRRPNAEPVMENAAIHTLEHLFATYVRNSEFSDSVIYFGPMGCRTGFYFIVRNTVSPAQAIELTKNAQLLRGFFRRSSGSQRKRMRKLARPRP